MQGKENQFLVTSIVDHFSDELKRFFDSGVCEKDMLYQEGAIWGFVRDLGRHLQQALVSARGDGYSGSRIDCGCHSKAEAHCKGRHRKAKLKTTFGDIALDRAYYQCPDCKNGVHPSDAKMGLVGDAYSPYLIKALSFASTGAESFSEGVRFLETYLGVTIDLKQAQEKVETWGARMRGLLHADGERLDQKEGERESRIDPDPGSVFYGMVDGSHVPVRPGEEDVVVGAGASGERMPPKRRLPKARDGDAETRSWREMKPCRLFPSESRTLQSKDHGVILDNHFTCHLGDWGTFSERVWSLILSLKAHERHETLVWIGDGAGWVWSMTDEWLWPGKMVEILDWYHAVEHLWDCAKNLHDDETERKRWVKARENLLWNGQVKRVIKLLKDERRFRRKPYRKPLDDLIGYYENNQSRMRYAWFRKQGYLIGSGPIESSNRWVIQARLKGAGMQWSADGADIMGLLRCLYKSERWDQAWDRLWDQRKAA